MLNNTRWASTAENQIALKRIFSLVSIGGHLDFHYSPFEAVEGLIDLRGIDFHGQKWQSVHVELADFSQSSHNGCWIEHCNFQSCRFERSDFTTATDHANTFLRCRFINAKFNGASIGDRGSKFINCLFEKCNFARAIFIRAEFDNCQFVNCNFRGIDFSGSSFNACSFSGQLSNVWFRGGFPLPEIEKQFGVPRKNRMSNVSFAEARLTGVTFSNECDLSTIVIPKEGNYRRYSGWKKRLEKLSSEAINWQNGEKREVDIFLFSFLTHADSQDWMLLNVEEMQNEYGPETFEKILQIIDSGM
jgi:fluoroquinolone resistance protein